MVRVEHRKNTKLEIGLIKSCSVITPHSTKLGFLRNTKHYKST